MTPTKGDVKYWLKAIGKNRDWLAMECGTEKGTVNNWLSPSGPFPASAMLKIQSLTVSIQNGSTGRRTCPDQSPRAGNHGRAHEEI